MAATFQHLAVPELKKELVARGATTSGRKLQLIERLEAYERNKNFKSDPAILPQPLEVGWPITGFMQLIQDHKVLLPKITMEQIDAYFVYRLAGDRQCTGDIKALEKGKLMLESFKILACSIKFKDEIYLTGIVGAAMKQKLTYNFKIKIEKKSGDPLNSHCECPVGRGPHGTCKHIATVFLMMKEFTESGTLRVAKTATDNLMMFNKPKTVYSGSPVKAEKLSSKRRVAEDFFDDPRPLKYRNDKGFNDRVRNIVFNYCSATSKDISLRYIYPRADIQTAAIDHWYCELPVTEHMINNALKVDKIAAERIEKETRGQSRNSSWFEAREWRLTASRFGEICRATCHRNTDKLCNSLANSKSFSTEATLHGKNYEKKALTVFESTYNLKTIECGLFVCVEHPYLGATPDAIVDDDALVEIKCPFKGRNEHIKPGPHFDFLQYDDNGNTVLKLSSKYYDQVQGQMYVSNRKFCYFVVYTFCDLFVQKIFIDVTYCECLIAKLEIFYKKYYRPFIASKM